MTEVVAGILEQNGKMLICQRQEHQPHGLKWEFPGGKVEGGESPEGALARELSEELGIKAEIGAEWMSYEFIYPGKKPILLRFFPVTRYSGEIENRIFARIAWCEPRHLTDYDFLEGDREFLAKLNDSGITAPL